MSQRLNIRGKEVEELAECTCQANGRDEDLSAQSDRALEGSRRAAVGLPKSGREVAMAGEAEIQAQPAQIIVTGEQVQRACQPQAQLVTVQWHSLDLLEHLCEIYGRDSNFRADIG